MTSSQLELRLPTPPATVDTPLVPARMVNEFVYCPRLAYLMWSQAEWVETGDTVDGRRIHTRVDKASKPLPEPETLEEEHSKVISRSLTLSSDSLGVIAKIDIAEAENGVVTPIDYKRGKRPHVAQGAYDPERVQVCLQAMLLEEHGYQVDEGAIWFAESRERVRITLDDELRDVAKNAANRLRLSVSYARIPPPLRDSPKCPRCALVSVCLPDEMNSLAGSNLAPRPIAVAQDEALPLVVQSQKAYVKKKGGTLQITEDDKDDTIARINNISDVALFGNVSISTPALTCLLEREIPVTFHSHGGWFRGIAHGLGHRNVEIRTEQYRLSFDKHFCVQFSRNLVAAKILNQRTILRRNWRGDKDSRKAILNSLSSNRKLAGRVQSSDELLGVEGAGAAIYFRAFADLLAPPKSKNAANASDGIDAFQFDARNRRPPKDPVNAMLSLAYAMLTRHMTIALSSVGFDPYRGFFHAPRYGRPALALDIMEPFRPIIADSTVLSVVNTGEVSADDFVTGTTGTALTSAGRKKFVGAFERRLTQETTHPIFGYRLSMRRLILVQARLLSRHLLGELPTYPHYLPR
ncbi:MAG: CRISPR-associated endonuclease Cas1 [Gammaproteobacteria bacterium]|nr:CRISPR-associated endonuclease Cas1 [Gammaproteobacteria bacterium]MDE0301946.1 CRISPR-associated endonuclease Cas1 [Gammaproteobacteria bacterium]